MRGVGITYRSLNPYFSMTCALRVARASADVMCVNDILSISFMSSTVNWDFGWAGAGGAGVAEEGEGDASDAMT